MPASRTPSQLEPRSPPHQAGHPAGLGWMTRGAPPPPVRTAARGQQAACVLVTIKQEQQLEPVAPAW